MVEWIKIRQKLPERANIRNFGKHLTIPNVGEEDNGKYMCKARNSAGEIVHNFYVTVEGESTELLDVENVHKNMF